MRRILLVATAVILCASARAQVALYVTSSSAHLGNVETGVSPGSGNQEQYDSFWTSGIGGGVTLNFLPLGPVSVGLDLRGSTRPGTKGADTAMGGIRLGIHPPVLPVKPYIQVSAGYLATRTVNVTPALAGSTFNNKYLAWEILGGIDYPLAHFVDFRVIELGGGTGVAVLGGPGSNTSFFTVNTGLVVHF